MSIKSLHYYDFKTITADEAEIFIKTAIDEDLRTRSAYYWSMAEFFDKEDVYYQHALSVTVKSDYKVGCVYDLFTHCYEDCEKFPSEIYFPTYKKLSESTDKRLLFYLERNFPNVSMIDIF